MSEVATLDAPGIPSLAIPSPEPESVKAKKLYVPCEKVLDDSNKTCGRPVRSTPGLLNPRCELHPHKVIWPGGDTDAPSA